MPREVTMPQLGMAQNAGKLIAWLKAPGDEVRQGDMLFEVETDKATMEVEAQADGYLTSVRAEAGQEVPVGQVIAMISETADAPDSAAEAPASNEAAPSSGTDLPEGQAITMPQLGMAQDSGVLVAWAVSLGDEVGPDDTLFEVETDKSTMEVPAGASGFLAATLADAGEAVPVGEAVAILSATKPDTPVAKSRAEAEGSAPSAAPEPSTPPAEEPAKAATKPAAKPATPAAPEGRILASPKARRIALQEGLDLARLRAAGHPEPYHVSDLDTLRALPDPTDKAASGGATAAASRHLTAEAATDGLAGFTAWAAKAHEVKDADAILAAFAGNSLGRASPLTVAVERFGQSRVFSVPPAATLSAVAPVEDAAPDLTLRDLRATRLRGLTMGAEDSPVLTITANGSGLTITLECAANQLAAAEAIGLITEFAGRAEDPLRHLL